MATATVLVDQHLVRKMPFPQSLSLPTKRANQSYGKEHSCCVFCLVAGFAQDKLVNVQCE
eukprot:5227867-Amphidinium_carterae.5